MNLMEGEDGLLFLPKVESEDEETNESDVVLITVQLQ